MDNLNILVEAKREYLGQLCLLMCPVMIETFEKFPSFFKSCQILIYEKIPKLISEQKKNIRSKKIKWIMNLKKLNKNPSIFLANEFFDALPIKQFSKSNGSWFEKFVFIAPG